MKLSTKSTYGLRAMINVALADEKPLSIADIAKKEGISIDYLEQLLNKLRRGGLITSVRGAAGGYLLARIPEEITVGDMVRVLEGSIYPAHCSGRVKGAGVCRNAKGCVPKTVWERLAKAIAACLDGITLDELCRDARANEKSLLKGVTR